jgi:hypothetical protein
MNNIRGPQTHGNLSMYYKYFAIAIYDRNVQFTTVIIVASIIKL